MEIGYTNINDPYPFWVSVVAPTRATALFNTVLQSMDLYAQEVLNDKVTNFLNKTFADTDYLQVDYRIYFCCEKTRLIFLLGWS